MVGHPRVDRDVENDRIQITAGFGQLVGNTRKDQGQLGVAQRSTT
jgi:hypothetical protein